MMTSLRAVLLSSAIFCGVVSMSSASASAQDAATQPAAPAPAEGAMEPPAQPSPEAAAPAAPPATAPAQSDAPTTVAQPPAAAAPSATAGKVGAPPAGKGQVVFFRPSKYVGWALSFSVHEGNTGVGKLGNGSYFVDVVDPGSHTFTIQSEAKDSLTLEVDAGETYYVQQTIGMGIVMGRPHLAPSDQAAFEKTSLKLSTKKPSDVKPAA